VTAPLAYSARQVAAALGVSEWTVYRQAKAGQLPSLLIGRRRVFPRVAIDAWLAERAAASLAPEAS
jgi:excisionase family DNA binding protein